MVEPLIVSFSGGKDSLLTLLRLQRDPNYRVAVLQCVLETETGAVKTHGVPRELIEAQAAALNLPVEFLHVPRHAPNHDYERLLVNHLHVLGEGFGADTVAFGDLHLTDIKLYREALLIPQGIRPLFPLWNTAIHSGSDVAAAFFSAGGQGIVVSSNLRLLPAGTAGKPYTRNWAFSLPPHIDPAGENGEFHTFVTHFPLFAAPIPVAVQERYELTFIPPFKERFEFARLALAQPSIAG